MRGLVWGLPHGSSGFNLPPRRPSVRKGAASGASAPAPSSQVSIAASAVSDVGWALVMAWCFAGGSSVCLINTLPAQPRKYLQAPCAGPAEPPGGQVGPHLRLHVGSRRRPGAAAHQHRRRRQGGELRGGGWVVAPSLVHIHAAAARPAGLNSGSACSLQGLSYDVARGARMGTFGLFFYGPYQHWWYR